MIHRLNGNGKQGAKEKPDQRHQRLKAAEPDAAGQLRPEGRLPKRQALAHGHRKGIHAQTHSQQQQFSDSHKKTSVPIFQPAQKSTQRDPAGIQVSSFQAEPGYHPVCRFRPAPCAPTTPSSRTSIAKLPRKVKTIRGNTQFLYNFSNLFSKSTSPTPSMPLNTQGTTPASR